MKTLTRLLIPIALILFLSPMDSWAMMHGEGRHMRPYGGYCKGPRWGWYGAQRTVKTVETTRALLEEFLVETDLLVGEIRDNGPFFEADVIELGESGEDGIEGKAVVDILVVDKRTGRIRSKF